MQAHCDDSNVSRTTLPSVLHRQAYLLFFAVADRRPTAPASLAGINSQAMMMVGCVKKAFELLGLAFDDFDAGASITPTGLDHTCPRRAARPQRLPDCLQGG